MIDCIESFRRLGFYPAAFSAVGQPRARLDQSSECIRGGVGILDAVRKFPLSHLNGSIWLQNEGSKDIPAPNRLDERPYDML